MPAIPSIKLSLGYRAGAQKFAEVWQIKTKVARAYVRALYYFTTQMEVYAGQHVPRDRGRLVADFRAAFNRSVELGAFVIGNPNVEDAAFVNAWPPWKGKGGKTKPTVNWSNGIQGDHYFDRAEANMPRLIKWSIERGIREEGLDVKMNTSAGALASNLFTVV